MKLLKDGKIRVTLEDNGYVIRPVAYSQSVFRIGFDGKLAVSMSSTSIFREETWDAIQKEISEGFSYMKKYVENREETKSLKEALKPTYVKSRDMECGDVCLRESGEVAIYLGFGHLHNDHGFNKNREGCNEIFATISKGSAYAVSAEDGVLKITSTSAPVYVDTYASKLRKIVKKIDHVEFDSKVEVEDSFGHSTYFIR